MGSRVGVVEVKGRSGRVGVVGVKGRVEVVGSRVVGS